MVLALDLLPDGAFRIWFDGNGNGDLTDDGPPRANASSWDGGPGGFATELQVPWRLLSDRAPFQEPFRIWFFSNPAGWRQGHLASHYSRTQLRGAVTEDGVRRTAWVVDLGYNDGDLTNDGLWVDRDGDGRTSADEWVPPEEDADGRAAVWVTW